MTAVLHKVNWLGILIEDKEKVKDLGIVVDVNLKYRTQMDNALNKANKKASWVFRTFTTRNVGFLKKLWKSAIQCHLDYGSILWAPVSTKSALIYMEGPLCAFTRRGKDMYNKSY